MSREKGWGRLEDGGPEKKEKEGSKLKFVRYREEMKGR